MSDASMIDVNKIVECGNCGKEIYYGNSFDSLFLTDVVDGGENMLHVVPKRVCTECHEKEMQQMADIEERTKIEKERKLLEKCENCRFRDNDEHEEPCRFCTINKISMFVPRGNMDDMKYLIGTIRNVLKDMEHLIKEIEKDGQAVRDNNPDSGSDDRDIG